MSRTVCRHVSRILGLPGGCWEVQSESKPIAAGLVLLGGLALSPLSQATSSGLADEASAWKRYAAQALQFDLGPGVAAARAPAAIQDPRREASLRLAMSVQATAGSGSHTRVGGSTLDALAAHLGASFRAGGNGLSLGLTSSVIAPEVEAAVGRDSRIRLGLTIANQRFATLGFGEAMPLVPGALGLSRAFDGGGFVEQSFGQGVHAGFESPLGEALSLGVQVQSKVDMEAFKTYRGFFTEPGDFDLPARAGLSLGWSSQGPFSLGLAVERIYFSDINAFTSRALPPRLLALLSDGSSPRFAWRDLTVYSAQLRMDEPLGGQVGLKFSSRQQPSPTSALLDLALRDTYSNTNVTASYSRDFGSLGAFSLGASYAPYQPVLGIAPYGGRYRDGAQLEAELNWSLAF